MANSLRYECQIIYCVLKYDSINKVHNKVINPTEGACFKSDFPCLADSKFKILMFRCTVPSASYHQR